MRRTLFFTLLTSLFFFCCNLSLAEQTESLAQTAQVQNFINKMAEKHDFDKDSLVEIFNKVKPRPEILRAMSRPAEAKPWIKYHDIFLTDRRADFGVKFWNKHADALARAEKEFGVPPSIIIAILGVETFYGERQGTFPVIDSLSTLAFQYPSRAKFFKKELEEYLLLTRENHIDPYYFKGSYAGAIGQPQFMPSSYRHYAYAFDHSEQKDLQDNSDHVIASVANYLQKNSWHRGEPVAISATVSGEKFAELPKPTRRHLRPTLSVKELADYGVQANETIAPSTLALFIDLGSKKYQAEYWLGLNNFYSITRYNPSVNYAMAVFQLSQQVEQRHQS